MNSPFLGPESPSGSHRTATIREAVVIADAAVEQTAQQAEKTARSTRFQWMGIGLLGAIVVGVGGFLAWCLITLGAIGTAQAQTGAKADTAIEMSKRNAERIEAVDAGTAAKFERLERKIDDNNTNQQRQLTDMQITLQAVLREVRKK